MINKKQRLFDLVKNYQTEHLVIVNNFLDEYADKLLSSREWVIIGAVDNDDAYILYTTFTYYEGFEVNVFPHVSASSGTSQEVYCVRFTGSLEQPEPSPKETWEAHMIRYLSEQGLVSDESTDSLEEDDSEKIDWSDTSGWGGYPKNLPAEYMVRHHRSHTHLPVRLWYERELEKDKLSEF